MARIAETVRPPRASLYHLHSSSGILNDSSGPAKGYTEALEHRLKETESALLRIVSVVDGATLQSAFEDIARGDYVDAPSDSNTDKAEKAAHWEQFPLSTPRDLVKWAVEQQVSQDRDAAPAPAAAMHPVRRTAVRFGQQLSEHDAAMEFETPFTKNVAEFAENFATISTSLGDLPHGLRGETVYQDDTFDMPEQFKQQYLW